MEVEIPHFHDPFSSDEIGIADYRYQIRLEWGEKSGEDSNRRYKRLNWGIRGAVQLGIDDSKQIGAHREATSGFLWESAKRTR